MMLQSQAWSGRQHCSLQVMFLVYNWYFRPLTSSQAGFRTLAGFSKMNIMYGMEPVLWACCSKVC